MFRPRHAFKIPGTIGIITKIILQRSTHYWIGYVRIHCSVKSYLLDISSHRHSIIVLGIRIIIVIDMEYRFSISIFLHTAGKVIKLLWNNYLGIGLRIALCLSRNLKLGPWLNSSCKIPFELRMLKCIVSLIQLSRFSVLQDCQRKAFGQFRHPRILSDDIGRNN